MASDEIVAAAGGKPFLASNTLPTARSIASVDESDWDVVEDLLKTWRDKMGGNVLRGLYYSAHENLRNFGIAIPENISRGYWAPVGWPAKAVRSLADLSAFEGFSVDGGTSDGLASDVAALFEANSLDSMVSQTIVSAYTHSCAFLTVSIGDDGRAKITPRSADWSSAIWDTYNNQINSAMTITDADRDGTITGFNVWLPDKVYICRKKAAGWRAEPQITNYGRPSVVAFSYDPQLNRPFGRSRISRPVMSLTDAAFRTILRMEGNAEFYAAPKLWFLGLDRDALGKDVWKSLISSINAVSRDVDDQIPELKQVSQASMQPHSDMLKTLAMMVASETNLPVNDLGITMDNPASAEAMAAAERKLSREADRQNRLFSRALKDVAGMALDLDDETMARVTPVWAPTREVSDAARADYYAKVAGVNQDFADSDIGLMKAGLTFGEIRSFRAYQQRKRAQDHIDQIRQQVAANRQEGPDGQSESPAAVGRQAPGTGSDAGTTDQGLSG
ncbi:phage portal protein [Bifidobacterium stellenboschense]|uniref:Phage portal protein n=1 Tax=Bifidobacterium stellenboschense TaxID=762211 RepID=A0A087DQM2_9BIFI|nr:phage portal protein [Bifidobacterium stellenboschense]KFI97822.1 phage portal protein [Bifidobacterium stellenboschense]